MSRTVPGGLLAHYQGRTTSLCHILKVTREFDGVALGYCSLDRDLPVDGFLYEAGLDLSNMSTLAGLAVGNLEISIFPDDILTAVDLLAGKWNGAVFELAIVNWRNTALGKDMVKTGTTGEVQLTEQGFFKLEFRGLMQAFQQPLGQVTQKTCRADLGDDGCKVDLTPWTHDRAVTTVTSQHVFSAVLAVEADDYYTEGKLKFLTGPNAGYWYKVKSFMGGVFTLAVGAAFTIGIGDTFTAVAGCQKRLIEDCKTKFDNVLNFQGEPHVPGADKLLSDPDLGT